MALIYLFVDPVKRFWVKFVHGWVRGTTPEGASEANLVKMEVFVQSVRV